MKVYVKISGGLCNSLFRIATGYSYSIDHNKTLLCDTSEKFSVHNYFDVYYRNFFKKLNLIDNIPQIKTYQQPDYEYRIIPYFEEDVYLSGFFQSENFFIHNRDKILDLFEIDDVTNNTIIKKYGSFLQNETCSIHVRRGDYKTVSNILPILPLDYYLNSVDIVGQDKLYLIFSDDIEWCKQNFSFIKNKIFIENNIDFIDLYLMSMCNHNIIANSTFSWWGAWLNPKENKKIISPKNWFGLGFKQWLLNYSKSENIKNNIIPDNWDKI